MDKYFNGFDVVIDETKKKNLVEKPLSKAQYKQNSNVLEVQKLKELQRAHAYMA